MNWTDKSKEKRKQKIKSAMKREFEKAKQNLWTVTCNPFRPIYKYTSILLKWFKIMIIQFAKLRICAIAAYKLGCVIDEIEMQFDLKSECLNFEWKAKKYWTKAREAEQKWQRKKKFRRVQNLMITWYFSMFIHFLLNFWSKSKILIMFNACFLFYQKQTLDNEK